MVKKEDTIRKFVVRQLIQCSDLSSLTLGILRRRYLEQVGRESLSTKDRQLMKTIVEEELLKMQESSDDEPLVKFVEKKRKRVDDDDADEGLKNEMARKKRLRHEESSPDSPDSGIVKAMNEDGQKEAESDKNTDKDSEGERESAGKKVKEQKQKMGKGKQTKEQEMQSEDESETKKRQQKQGKMIESEDDEELEYSDEDGEKLKTTAKMNTFKKKDSSTEERTSDRRTKNSNNESEDESEMSKEKKLEKRKDMKKKKPVETDAVKAVERQVFGSSSESDEEETKTTKTKKSIDSESESRESEEEDADKSSFREKKKEEHEKNVEEDSDSSSLPSLEDEEEQEQSKEERKPTSVTKKKRSEERESTPRGKDEENKTVARLKRYIALCGVRRNYKKLLDGCRSIKAKVTVLKKELEELGVEGQPTIEKCKKARLKREEAQEVAELDVSNIITTQGRPKRRAAWPPRPNVSPPSSVYKCVVDSDSDSGDSHTNRGHKRAAAWRNLQGIISDDGESD
ncbi:HIRA-interacting protein 3 [Triplophysa dalaica]|uniref:HIRA-interacting protein 3 n=1 Tax=Triplophysa dalaica TaxID=1582913 RepID=UPI0024DF32A9|nr:HIRA-interacting protein 3 [Triplophysa dalaica]